MAVPEFQMFMLPILKCTANGEISIADARERVARELNLTEDDLRQLLPSGRQTVFVNRMSWARYGIERAELIHTTRRAHFVITDRGKELLVETPDKIDSNLLRRYPEWVDWMERSRAGSRRPDHTRDSEDTSDSETPEERLEADHAALQDSLRAEVLERLHEASPAFFENAIIDLLVAMGYGGGRAEMGKAVGKSGDGGIDGVVKEDALGLDAVYVQAKKYASDHAIGPGDVRNFSGALDDVGTTKGLFVTTSSFTKGARDYADRIAKRIILVDGAEMARLMVEHNVSVRTSAKYEIKRIDEDYYNEN